MDMDPHLNVVFVSIRKILQVFELINLSTPNWFMYQEHVLSCNYTLAHILNVHLSNKLHVRHSVSLQNSNLCMQV